MALFKRLQKFILPEQIDFFGGLLEQIGKSKKIIELLSVEYAKNQPNAEKDVRNLIKEAKKTREKALQDLNRTFITPVDKEAIGRLYFHLNQINLKVKHFLTEMDIYNGIGNISDYQNLLDILRDEIDTLNKGFALLTQKNFLEVHKNTDHLLHLSNRFSKQYAKHLKVLFEASEQNKIFIHKEVLFQLKQINHVIIDANYSLEDMVYKMN